MEKVHIDGSLTMIDAARQTFDLREIDNRRFLYNPDTRVLIFGEQAAIRGDASGSHLEDHGNSGVYEPFDSFIRGWAGTGEAYQHGVIHFTPKISETDTELLTGANNTLQMFRENGADGDTLVRGFGSVREQALSEILSGSEKEAAQVLVYPFRADYALEKGEIEEYNRSMNVNRACMEAIDKAVSDSSYKAFHYDLDAAARLVIKRFGFERLNFVLANVVSVHAYDGRYSNDNKKWAWNFGGTSQNREIYCNTHPAILDDFVTKVRKIHVHELAQTIGKYEQSHHMARHNRMTYLNTDTGVFIPYDPSGHKQLLHRSEDIAAKQRAAAERRRERQPTLAAQLAEARSKVQPPAPKNPGRQRSAERA